MMTRSIRVLGAALAMALVAGAAAAQNRLTDLADIVSVELLPGWRLASGNHMTALDIRLAPGWKTYWRVPGEAGLPPRFAWQGSANFAGANLFWPTPEVFEAYGLTSLGYIDRLLLPIEVLTRDPDAQVDLRLDLEIGVCADVCIPASGRVSASFAAGSVPENAEILAAMANRPRAAAGRIAARSRCGFAPEGAGLRLTSSHPLPAAKGKEIAVVEMAGEDLWIGQSQTRREGDTLVVTAEVKPLAGRALVIDRSSVRVTVFSGGVATEFSGCNR